MLAKARPKKAGAARDIAAERLDKAFKDSLAKVEELAKKRLLQARDPFRTGLMMAREIRRAADNIDAEVIAQGIEVTEAGVLSQ
jgi:hypothetical protein